MDHDCPRIKPSVILEAMRSTSVEQDGVYVIGSFDHRVTVRSQQIRALNLLYALHASGRVKTGDCIAVIGGGAAGLTAAAAGAQLGFKVTLLEKSPELMPMQRACRHRWLHPHIYDWPEGGSTARDAGLPLMNWATGTAADVAEQLETAFDRLEKRSEIKIWFGVELGGAPVALKLSWSGRPSRGALKTNQNGKQFRAIIYAVGFGLEAMPPGYDIPNAPTYWSADTYEQNVAGEPLRVLISGCGDGGLIDLLRVRLRNFDHQNIFETYVEKPCEANELERLREQLLAIESEARLKKDAEVSEFLERAYERLVVPAAVDEAILGNLRDDTSVELNGTKTSAFTLGSSILNRFLASRLLFGDGGGYQCRTMYVQGKLTIEAANKDFVFKFDDIERGPYELVIFHHGPVTVIEKLLKPEGFKSRMTTLAALDITRDRLWPEKYFERGLTVPFDAKAIRSEDGEQLVQLVGQQLGWRLTDDALHVALPAPSGLRIPVRASEPTYRPDLDELRDVAYDESMHAGRVDRWLKPYKRVPSAAQYLVQNLEHEAWLGKVDSNECKIGFAALDGNSFGGTSNQPALVVRAMNHLLTFAFNRHLATARIQRLSEMEKVWRTCLEEFAKGPSFVMPCPSQLFIELALVTLDGDVPISRKDSKTSVYALRNQGIVKTCGPERGSAWATALDTSVPNQAFYDVSKSVTGALSSEYRIAMPGATLKTPGPSLTCAVQPAVSVHSLALQCFHLNSALLGICVVPFGTQELRDHLKAVKESGGMLFGPDPEFLAFDQLDRTIRASLGTTSWHGTALARLQLLNEAKSSVEQLIESMK